MSETASVAGARSSYAPSLTGGKGSIEAGTGGETGRSPIPEEEESQDDGQPCKYTLVKVIFEAERFPLTNHLSVVVINFGHDR